MRQLTFEVGPWLASNLVDPLERATLAPLTIRAGASWVVVTEVNDSLARTVRDHVNVPLYPFAHWLVVNWWRLRWEAAPPRGRTSYDWLTSHSMASIGGDTPWPQLMFAGDGESVQVVMQAESASDVAALRYTQSLNVEIPALDFEAAVDELLDTVLARLKACAGLDCDLYELIDELREERSCPEQTRSCRMQAVAGVDPGAATPEWLAAVEKLQDTAGAQAGQEMLAAVPIVQGGLSTVQTCMEAMTQSSTVVDLRDLPELAPQIEPKRIPWQRGAALAQSLRQHLGVPSGPLDNDVLQQLIQAHLPLPTSKTDSMRALEGGYRNGVNGGKTSLLVGSSRIASQRFFVARLISAALMSNAEQRVLPVTRAMTAFQKAERSFAQELLCPWYDLKQYVDEHVADEDALADAAEYFQVSEFVVENTLENKGYWRGHHNAPETRA